MNEALDRHRSPSALVLASDAAIRRQLVELARADGARVCEAGDLSRGWETLREGPPFDVVVAVDDVLRGDGKHLIQELTVFDRATFVVAVVDSTESGRQALAAGAYDVFSSPVDGERFAVTLRHIGETRRLRERSVVLDHLLSGGVHLGDLVTRDPGLIAIVETIRRLARYRGPVLVVGERGTEHQAVGRALHDLGRPDEPFIVCAAAGLSAAELRQQQAAAAGGTLFIDDLSALAADVSAALTAVLEEATVTFGSCRPRIVARYPQAVPPPSEPGDPRADLYRQLAGMVLVLPPLRERPGDAVLVARELVAAVGRERGCELAIARPVEDALLSYAWPGNLEELKTVVVTAATTANGPAIELHDLPPPLAEHASRTGQIVSTRLLRDLEMQHIHQVLQETQGNKSRAARILGLSRWALQRKLQKYAVAREEEPSSEA